MSQPSVARTDPVVVLEAITRTYHQGEVAIPVLKGISLAMGTGEFVALQGPSGSGKSTLLHIIGLLDRPSTGRYLLAGRDVSGLDDDALSDLRNRTLGFVFQSFYLIPYASALENVMLPGLYSATPAGELRKRGLELLAKVGLADRAGFTPSQLSGGQQQRVALARALINAPRMILADEPTGQLDSATSTDIMDLLREINAGGTTVVVVTHDEATAAYASRRIHLRDGLVVDQGT